MRRIRSLPAAAVAGALLVLSGGCGERGYDSLSAQPEPLTPDNIEPLLTKAMGDVDSYSYRMTMTVAGKTLRGFGDVRLTKPSAMRGTMDVPGSTAIETLAVGGAVYVKGFPTARPWLRVDARTRGLDAQTRAQLRQVTRPLPSYATFANASKVTLSGRGPVGDVDTTHYVVVVPTRSLPGVSQKLTRKKLAALSRSLRNLTMDIWVDRDYLVRKLAFRVRVAKQEVSSEVLVEDYDAPVRIAAPPASQVTRGFGR